MGISPALLFVLSALSVYRHYDRIQAVDLKYDDRRFAVSNLFYTRTHSYARVTDVTVGTIFWDTRIVIRIQDGNIPRTYYVFANSKTSLFGNNDAARNKKERIVEFVGLCEDQSNL